MYRGEYMECSDQPRILKEYTIGTVSPGFFNQILPVGSINGLSQASSDSILAPDEIVLLGSLDGQRWTLLDHQIGLASRWSTQSELVVPFINNKSYSRYRWIFPKLCRQIFAEENTDKGILCTRLFVRTEDDHVITVFPEGVTSDNGLIFIQVQNYPSSTREYAGDLVTYLEPVSSGINMLWIVLAVVIILTLITLAALIYLKKISNPFRKSA